MLEERLAQELKRRNLDREREKREYQRICAESEEIRDLKQKLQAAYTNKERTAQLQETQVRREIDVVNEARLERAMLENAERELQRVAQAEARKKQDRLRSKEVLQAQILEKERLRQEAYEQYLKERGQVDAIVNRIIQEDIRAQRDAESKKQQALRDMFESFKMRDEQRAHEIERDKQELDALRMFQLEQEARETQLLALRAKKEEARNEIFERLEADERKRREEQEQLENLKNDLYYEEFEFNERMKELERQDQQLRVRQELMAAREYQMKLKEERRAEEDRLEKEFRDKMLAKFAEDDRLEQMNAQRRRMKELEHKHQIDLLWDQKKQMLKAQQDREDEERRAQMADDQRKRDIIEQERQRLLREHLPVVASYLPKGTLRTQDERRFIAPS